MALAGDLEAFEVFITENNELINMKCERGNVALHVAASKGHLDMISLLLRKGANIDVQDCYGNTPLLYAIDKMQQDAVGLLIRHGASVHISDFRGNTPLHSACSVNHKEICEFLLRQGADAEAMDFGSQRPADRTKVCQQCTYNNQRLFGAISIFIQSRYLTSISRLPPT